MFNFSLPTANDFNYNAQLQQYNQLGTQLTDAMNRGLDTSMIDSQMNNISANLANMEDVANYFGVDPSQVSPAQMQFMQNSMNSQTGLTGFVNQNFGGWGNVMQGIGQLGNLWMGYQGLGLAKDQLALQEDAFKFNKALSTKNYANQVEAYNQALSDRLRARAFTETGNKNAYDKQIEERKLDKNL